MDPSQILPDVLSQNLLIVFIGTAAGRESARRSDYYAHYGNSFWRTLCDVGLTPRLLGPHEFKSLLDFGLGLTDFAKLRCGSDSSLSAADFDVPALCAKIERFTPRVAAFNGKKAASVFYDVPTSKITFGKHPRPLGPTVFWTLPSTSGGAHRYWNIEHWKLLAESLRQNNQGI